MKNTNLKLLLMEKMSIDLAFERLYNSHIDLRKIIIFKMKLICTKYRKEVKNMKKKLLALIMTACMVTTMFTACGKADSSAASETEGQNTAESNTDEGNTESGEKETIEFWDMIWGSDADAYEATVREICEQVGEEIGANVEVRFLPWDNFTQVYLTAVASGTAPDVGTTGTTLPSQVHMMGGTMNLNSILEDWKAENNPILDAIPQAALDVQTFDGELVAMPFDVQPECITYNEAIFKECGITEEPTTFDEFLDVCRTIKEKRPDIIPFVAAAGDHEVHTLFTYFCMLNGTNVVTEDLKPNVSSPEVLHVCEFLKTMYDEGLIAESAASMTSGERDSTYVSGNAAMIFRHNLDSSVATINKEVWDNSRVMGLLKGPDTDTPVSMTYFEPVLAFNNDHPELTKAFIKSYMEHYKQIYVTGSRGTLPTRSDWYSDEIFNTPIHNDLKEKCLPSMQFPTWPVKGYYSAYNQVEGELLLQSITQEILMGNDDLEGLAKQTDEKIQKALDEAK